MDIIDYIAVLTCIWLFINILLGINNVVSKRNC